MRETTKLVVVLAVLTAISGALLGFVNSITIDKIQEHARIKAEAALYEVFPQAESFEAVENLDGTGVDACFKVYSGGETIGYIARVTTSGFKGPFEVTVGMNSDLSISGISIGGATFAETVDIGTKVKEPEFTGQFIGKTPPLVAGEDVQTISGATISSKAAIAGVEKATNFLLDFIAKGGE